MTRLSFVTVDVFTTARFAGNPLAIVRIPNECDLSTAQMQKIAQEFNLSETIFLHENQAQPGQPPEWRVRIFVTTGEIPFAGHPTIGSSCYALGALANNAPKGKLICNAGPIELEYLNGVAKASIPHNVRVHSQYPFTLEQVYALQPALKDSAPPMSIDVVSPVRGMNFVCVELADLETLGKVTQLGPRPQPALDDDWKEVKPNGFMGSYWYVVTDEDTTSDIPTFHVRTRMIEGPLEDPATGSAACGLCSFLSLRASSKKINFKVTQGVEMGRKSDIGVVVTLKEDLRAIERVELSGSAVQITEGALIYD